MAEKKRFPHIDIIETIGILFVVLYHSTIYKFDFVSDAGNEAAILYYLRYYARTILSSCVPLFFFANGFLLFAKPYDNSKHIKRTLKMTLLPLFGLVLCPIYMAIDNQKIVFKVVVSNWLSLGTEWGMSLFWFTGALVCIYILFPALKSLYDNDEKPFLILAAVILALTFGIRAFNILLSLINVVIKLPVNNIDFPIVRMNVPFGAYGYSYVYFCLGGIAYRYESISRGVSKTKRNISALFMILVACSLLYTIGFVYSKHITGSIWDVVWEGYDSVPTLINVIAIYLLSLNFKNNRIAETISKNTIWVYLLHGLIIRLTRPSIKEVPICQNFSFNVLYAVFIIAVCVGVIEAIKKLLISKH